MRFHTTVERSGKTATGVEVPTAVVESLGPSRRPLVRATINGHTYRSSVASMGGRFMLGISAEVRASAGVEGGDEVDVDLELDTEPREVALPSDFTDALDADPKASKFFDGLSYSNKRRLVMAIDAAKAAETRQRRIATTVSNLREGRS